jgi:hypothetical protein
MTQFLIVYDQVEGKVLSMAEFDDTERSRALEERFDLERRYQDQPHVEVIALGADTRADLEITHGRYFKTVAQLAEDA